MAVHVADFTVIQGDANRRVGDGALLWEKEFRTEKRLGRSPAFLMLMVKGLTYATDAVVVKINNIDVGRIYPDRWHDNVHREAAKNHWSTQIINIGSGVLNNGVNELQLEAVGYPESTATDHFDDFYVRDVICFFKQAARSP